MELEELVTAWREKKERDRRKRAMEQARPKAGQGPRQGDPKIQHKNVETNCGSKEEV